MNLTATLPLKKILKRPVSLVARRLLGTVTHVETSEPVLALTFDDGPHPQYTPRLLEVLDKFRARATFFCVGKFVARHPEVIHQAVGAGHVVANHTWDHSSLPVLTHRERVAQIQKCTEVLKPYGSRLFRPPYGHQNFASRLDLLRQGYQVIGWTHSANDWRIRSVKEILEQALREIRPGSIIVFHDRIAAARSPVYFNREPTIEAVRLLLERFSGRYRFVTVPDLTQYGQVVRKNWYRDADPAWLTGRIEEDGLPAAVQGAKTYQLNT